MQNIIVGIIVAVAAFFTLRSLYRIFTGKSKGCGGCGSSTCDSCDGGAAPQQDITKITTDKDKDNDRPA